MQAVAEYEAVQRRLSHGWNTWNTRSVLSHVLLPEGVALNVAVKEYRDRSYLKEALIGRKGQNLETVVPGVRTWDGGYTEMTVTYRGVAMRVQSGTDKGELLLLVTPLAAQRVPATLVIEGGILWNRRGYWQKEDGALCFHTPARQVRFRPATGQKVLPADDPYLAVQGAHLALVLTEAVAFHTGDNARSRNEIAAIFGRKQEELETDANQRFGDAAETYRAIQTCLAWDTIYDPGEQRVISPVSRPWNVNWGGYVLFCWDTYFAALLAAIDHRDLAYANIVEITRALTPEGFVPNFGSVSDLKSYDRSQPPVGALVLRALFQRFGDRWLVEMLFDDLLRWNRWWHAHRRQGELLCWGSNPYPPRADAAFETREVDNAVGAMLESGLDNSPLWDDIPFDPHTHLQAQHDAGLNGLYVQDCEALAELAALVQRPEATELRERADAYRRALRERLWHESDGLFLNRRTDTEAWNPRVAPTNFYPLAAGAATPSEASRTVREHLLHPERLGGEHLFPSISREDPAYPEQNYWRGRIWAPLNFLVYLGVCRYDLPEARREIAEKSEALLLHGWRADGRVCENYHGDTGIGGEVRNSDAFYHWGGLLGLPALIERGLFPAVALATVE